jgi:hypothetical protein
MLKHWKNFSWYCVFQYGTCCLLFADERFIKWLFSTGVIFEYRKVGSLFKAYKFFKTYNEEREEQDYAETK